VRYIWLVCVFAQFVLEFGIQPIPLKIKLSDVFLDAHMRVELLGLNSGRLPCFDAIAVSLMSKPTVDFSLRVANLVDIMSIPDLTKVFMPAFGPTPTPAAGTTGARPEAKAMLGKFAPALVSWIVILSNALCPIYIFRCLDRNGADKHDVVPEEIRCSPSEQRPRTEPEVFGVYKLDVAPHRGGSTHEVYGFWGHGAFIVVWLHSAHCAPHETATLSSRLPLRISDSARTSCRSVMNSACTEHYFTLLTVLVMCWCEFVCA
jgi:hypothetical protein